MHEYSALLGPYAYGVGFQQDLFPADPAAGAEKQLKVPGDRAWRLVAGQFAVTTSAVAGSRRPALVVQNGDGTEMVRFRPAGGGQAASTTSTYQLVPGFTNDGLNLSIAFTPLLLQPGWRIGPGVGFMDAGDQIKNIRLLVEEFPIGRGGYSVSGLDVVEPAEMMA